jgi:uncharacterized repeat protein (TIGR03806 family)
MSAEYGLRSLPLLFTVSLSAALALACSDGGGDGTPGGSGGSASGATATGGGGATAGGGAAGANNAGSTAAGTGGSAGSSSGSGVGGSAGAPASSACVPTADGMQPMLLSATECVNMADPTKPAAGAIPYSVRSPLWSDGAAKQRFVHLPAGGKIKTLDCSTQADACKADSLSGDDGHWEMPIGTVLVKNFSIENKLIETRLIERRSMSKWLYFSYEWNDAGTEATLLPDDNVGKDKPVGSGQQVWHYPGRQQCPQCHTAGSGFTLGPTTPQLNSDFAYAEGMMNQVEKFKQLGAFDTPPKMLAGLPVPEGADGTVEQRALSYIEANCAICHRPAGEYGSIDLRWGTAFADMKLCEVVDRDMVNVPKYRLVPGDPAKSTMSFRMHTLNMDRMPKVGSLVVDTAGAKLVDDWITGLPANSCPPQP